MAMAASGASSGTGLDKQQQQPYSIEQVAFLLSYRLLSEPQQRCQPVPVLLAKLEEQLQEGAAEGVYPADGTTLLHAAAMYAHAGAVVERLCQAKRQHACVASKSLGYLPLHYACCNGAPLDVVRILFECHPPGAAHLDKVRLATAQRRQEREARTAGRTGRARRGVSIRLWGTKCVRACVVWCAERADARGARAQDGPCRGREPGAAAVGSHT